MLENGVKLLHTGDLGDILACLPILRSLGGGEIVISDFGGHARETMRGERYAAIEPLLTAQPYVTKCSWEDVPTGVTHDLSHFRRVRGLAKETLAHRQARFLQINIDLAPWLNVPTADAHGRVVIARSLRYHNFFFPWPELAHKYRQELVFVGLPAEYEALKLVLKRDFPYQPTKDLLELARFIAGARLFIGNQSAPFWVAAGLGVPFIQESWQVDLNCLVPRANGIYTPTPQETRTLMFRLKRMEVSQRFVNA